MGGDCGPWLTKCRQSAYQCPGLAIAVLLHLGAFFNAGEHADSSTVIAVVTIGLWVIPAQVILRSSEVYDAEPEYSAQYCTDSRSARHMIHVIECSIYVLLLRVAHKALMLQQSLRAVQHWCRSSTAARSLN